MIDQTMSAIQVPIPAAPPLRLQPNNADMPTTVYVGHICNRVPEDSIKELLDICGQITKWSRQPDPITGKWAHFGFCEFKRLEGAWRAIDLLHDRQLGSKKLVVKADAKIQERIAEFPLTHRFHPENEQRLRATVDAILTTINATWRESAIAKDAELTSTPQHKTPMHPAPLPSTSSDTVPDWFRESRRGQDRLRRIDRCKRDRKSDLEKALRDWEYEEKKLHREFYKEHCENIDEDERMRLIEQDCGDQRVVSGFTPSERRREIEADERDRQNEEKEIQQKLEKDIAELRELELQISEFPQQPGSKLRLDRSLPPKTIGDVPPRLRTTIKKIPLTVEAIRKTEIDWSVILRESVLLKLRSWLKRKMIKIGVSEYEASVMSRYVCKTLEVHRGGAIDTVQQCLSKHVNRLDEELISHISKKCMQLIIFSQLAV